MATRIMVINDTEEILELFRDILEEEGYEVSLHAHKVRELHEVRAVEPELLIVDQVFGNEKSGWELIQKMKMARDLRLIPIVLCTADKRSAEELESHLTSLGVVTVLKPFEIEDLLEAVRVALEHAQVRLDIKAESRERMREEPSGPVPAKEG